jgi:hypothetical protein
MLPTTSRQCSHAPAQLGQWYGTQQGGFQLVCPGPHLTHCRPTTSRQQPSVPAWPPAGRFAMLVTLLWLCASPAIPGKSPPPVLVYPLMTTHLPSLMVATCNPTTLHGCPASLTLAHRCITPAAVVPTVYQPPRADAHILSTDWPVVPGEAVPTRPAHNATQLAHRPSRLCRAPVTPGIAAWRVSHCSIFVCFVCITLAF